MAGNLFIVAAPSGAGKTSLVKALLAHEPALRLSVSHTTRAPRPGEIDGVHYHFVTAERFAALVAERAFLEHALVHGNHYGTTRAAVQPILDAGGDVLLEIDFQGAALVREQCPDCVGVFILPPSRAELERRLRARASDDEAVIRRRLANSREEVSHAREFDFVIVNDDFDEALADLRAIVRTQRLRRAIASDRLSALLAELTA